MIQSQQVAVTLNADVYDELKGLAEPLVDDINTVISRLIRHWKLHPRRSEQADVASYWTSARGEALPVGLPLRATYLNQPITAEITADGIVFNGKAYGSPSQAAIAAKKSLGAKGQAANQNGWDFWEYFDETTKAWRFLRGKR